MFLNLVINLTILIVYKYEVRSESKFCSISLTICENKQFWD